MKNKYLVALLALFLPCMGAFAQCLTPTDLAFSNVTSNSVTISWNGNADSYTVSYGIPYVSPYIPLQVLKYGDMVYAASYGSTTEETWNWGVCFTHGMLVNHNVLTKIGFYNTAYNTNDITIRVYSGNDAPQDLLLTKVVTAVPNSYQLVILDTPVFLTGYDIWITLEERGTMVMTMDHSTVSNSRWIFNGSTWVHPSGITDMGFCIQGHFENHEYNNIVGLNQVTTTNQSIELTGLNPEHTYVVKVQGHCGQGDDSEWSDELIFITKNAGCPGPTGLSVSNITHNTAELDWSGESDSYSVRYRNKAHDVGFFEQFTNNSSTPPGWSEKAGSLSGVQNGTVTLTDDHSWSYGSFVDFFDDHAYIDIQGTMYKWLISPSVAIREGSFLNFNIALTRLFPGPAITNETDRFIVAVYDESEGTWNIHREWNNLSNTGENVNIDLSAYAGKNVRVAFYVEQIENPYELTLHIDNVRLSSPVPLGAWQTAVESAAVTHTTLTDLVPETPYEVEVRGVCSGSISMVADTISFSTRFIAPCNLAVDDVTIDAATLSWTENGDATAWQIQLNDEPPMAVNTNPFILSGLTPDTQYTVKVRSQKGGDYSAWSDAIDFSTLFYCYPPTQLEVVECTLNAATLGWHDHGTATGWQVCIDGDEAHLITVNTNQYVMTNLDAQTQYTVKVRAICGETHTDWTNELSFVPVLFCNPPTLTVDDVDMTTADLSWTAISGADSYTVSYHSVPVNAIDPIITGYTATDGTSGYNSGENYTNLVDNDRTTKWCRSKDNVYIEFHSELSFVPTGYILTTGNDNATAHGRNPKDWVIKAKLEAGDSWTTIANVTNNYVMQDVNFTDYEFELNNTNAYRYFRFEVSAVQSGNSFQLGELRFRGQLAPINTTSTSVSLTGLIPKTDYVAEVRGNIGDLSTNWSNEVNFTTLPVCAAPTDLSTLNVTCNSMILSWNQDGTVDDWRICLNNDETNLITATTNPYTLTGLSAQTAYSVKVCARKGGEHYSYWSEPIVVTTTAFYQEPTNFAATEIHSYNAVLNWTENSDANEWRLCLNDDMANLITVTTKPFNLTGLTPESTYTVKISAYHDGLFSGWSDLISFTTPVLTPSLTVSNVGPYSANLNWTNTTGASYTVRYNRVPTALETVIFTGYENGSSNWGYGYSGSEPTSSMVNNTSHSGSYSFQFVANPGTNAQFQVSPSFEDCFYLEFYYKTNNTSETFQILFDIGNNNQSSTEEISVNTNGQWQKFTCDIPQNITKLRIKYCSQSQSALWIDDIVIASDHLTVETNTNSAQLTGLVPGATYSVKVQTKHGVHYSEWSDAVEFTTYDPPTNLTVSNLAETVATIGWTENGNATQWQLCLNNDQNNLIAVNTNPFTLEGLTQETHYTVKVRDCYEGYNSAWSDAVDFTTLAYCAAPTDLAVDGITRLSATLSWNADSDSYKVFYRTTGEWVLATENLTENTFTFTGLSPETHYEAYVKGVCNGIESNASGIIGFTTLLDNVPTLTVSGITYTSAGLSWTETPGANSYEVSLNNSTGILVTSGYTPTDGTVTNENESYSNLVDNNKNSKWFVNTGNGSNFTGCYIEFCSQHDFVPTGYVLTTANDTDTQGTHPGRNPKTWAIMAKLHLEDPWTVIESVTDNYVMQNVPLTDYEFTLDNNTPYRYFRFEVLDVQNSSNHRFQLGEMRFLGYSKNSVCLTDLEPATTYSAKVRAKVGDSYGEWSDEISFNTFGGLGAPTLTVSNVASTSADLNWTENPEAIGYAVSLNDAIVSFPSQIITGYTATSGAGGYNTNEGYANLVDNDRSTKWCRKMENVYIEFHSESRFVPTGYILTTGSDNATAHGRNPKDWVIKAKLKVGDPWTTIATVTNDQVLQDVNTTDFEFAIDNHLPYRYFRFEVSANQGNDSFQLGEFRFLGYVPTNSLHLADLLPDTDYSVKVRSDLGASYSDWSNTVDFRTLIQSPTNLTVTDIDYTSATLGWAANSSITQWQICLNGDEDHLILTDTNPYTLTGLNPHTHYTVKVRNCQEGADDAWSDEVGFTTPLYITPPTLTVSDISQTSVVLNWTEISGVDGYTISVNDAIIPDPIITGYTATSGAGGYNTNEGYANLVDNDRNTKWCRSSSGVYIEFHSQQDFVPTGYVLTTANDTHKNPQRNPKNWVIKAKLNAGDPWTLIATVTNDQVLQNVSTTDFEFAIDNSATYRYFRFEVSAVQSGDSFQLGELRFRGKTPTNSRILTGLLPETEYAIKVRANLGESFSVWSEEVHIITFDGITFFADGNWHDAGNWNVSRVPGTDDNVNIAAQAVVPAGYTAHAKHVDVNDGGSITIEDGGQFVAENEVKVAMQKNIAKTSYWGAGGGYTPDNWYFIAPSVDTEGSDYSVTGLITEGDGNGYDLYRLNTTVWENYKAVGGHYQFDLERGRGYLYASENGTEITFNGNAIPFSETSIPLSDGFNLVGNPYTFNTYVNRPYYKLNYDRTDIELVNNNAVIAPCDGVLIDAEGTDQVTFTKTNQLAQATNNGSLAIAVARQTSNRGVAAPSDKAVVSFNEGSQLGKFYFMQQDANIYIPQDGKDFAIAFSGKRGELPLCFKAMKNGKYTITVVPENVKVDYLHLIDNLTGTDVDLLATSSYTFEGRTGDYASRFRLVFNVTENGDNEDFAFISNGDIVIIGTGTLQVIDVLGRTLLSQDLSSLNSHLSNLPFNSGVYVLRLIKGSDVKVQKIILP